MKTKIAIVLFCLLLTSCAQQTLNKAEWEGRSTADNMARTLLNGAPWFNDCYKGCREGFRTRVGDILYDVMEKYDSQIYDGMPASQFNPIKDKMANELVAIYMIKYADNLVSGGGEKCAELRIETERLTKF